MCSRPLITASATAKSVSELRLWHRRFAHLHSAAIQSSIDGFSNNDTMCDVCVQAKHKQRIYAQKSNRQCPHSSSYILMPKRWTISSSSSNSIMNEGSMAESSSEGYFQGVELHSDHVLPMHITRTEKERAILIDSQAPIHFCREAVRTAVYLHRHTPNSGVPKRDTGMATRPHMRLLIKCYNHMGINGQGRQYNPI